MAILQFVNTMGEATAGKIARQVGLPRPTVYRILDTLVESGLLYRSPSAQRVYRLTEAVGKLSTGLGDEDPVVAAARRVLQNASPDLFWPVFLSTYTEEGMVIRETTRGSSVFWTELGWVGAVAPFLEVSPGWAFLAHATPDLQKTILKELSPETRERLEVVRKQGYALDHDSTGRVVGISVPVGEGENLVGALATFWEASEGPEPILADDFLASLDSLRRQILAERSADAEGASGTPE